jgi:hypothetical protein
MDNDRYVYLAIDYLATGEGRSIFLLITRAYARSEDYEVQPEYDLETGYKPGVLKGTRKDIALRELREKGVDPYFMQGVEVLESEEFLKRYKHMLPVFVTTILEQNGNEGPGDFNYFMDTHFNYG